MSLVTPTPIPEPGLPLPDRADRSTFADRMEEQFRWQRENLAPGAETLAQQTYENASEAVSAATGALAASNYKGQWSALSGALAIPASVYHSGQFWALLQTVPDVTAVTPGVSPVWAQIGGVSKSGDTMTGPLSVPSGASGAQVPQAQEAAPPGEIRWFARNTAPTGFIKANGANVSRTTYADLFAAIGTTFGVGDGSTTFNLPDLRGYVPRGWDDGRGVDTGRAFGSTQADGIKESAAGLLRMSTNVSLIRGTPTGEFSISAMSGATGVAATTGTTGSSYAADLLKIGSATETRMKNIALLACIKF
jgi:microcystin-dependent protein